MALKQDEYALEQQLRKATADRAAIITGSRTIAPEVLPPPSRAEFDTLAAELKTSLSRLAMNDLEILSLQRELIAETRARELRTAYPHEDADTDARFV